MSISGHASHDLGLLGRVEAAGLMSYVHRLQSDILHRRDNIALLNLSPSDFILRLIVLEYCFAIDSHIIGIGIRLFRYGGIERDTFCITLFRYTLCSDYGINTWKHTHT